MTTRDHSDPRTRYDRGRLKNGGVRQHVAPGHEGMSPENERLAVEEGCHLAREAWEIPTSSTHPAISSVGLGDAVSGPVTTESYTIHTNDKPDE